jgi:hypothetical protein
MADTRAVVRLAVGNYLQSGIVAQAIPYLSTVWPNPPVLANEADFYSANIPGEGAGAMIFVYLGETTRKRIAPGPKSPITNTYGGRKYVTAQTALMCYFRSTKEQGSAQAAADANDEFVDGLVSWIEADRNLGTAPGSNGAVPSGAIFQAGEGGINCGTDLTVHSLLPRPNRFGTITIFTSLEMKVDTIVIT